MPSVLKYNPKVIQDYAEWLYSRASLVILSSVLIISVPAALAGPALLDRWTGSPVYSALIMLVPAAIIVYIFGYLRTLKLRFQAQAALCQMQIELNTRRMATSATVAADNYANIQP